jgi:hypothetical protein
VDGNSEFELFNKQERKQIGAEKTVKIAKVSDRFTF